MGKVAELTITNVGMLLIFIAAGYLLRALKVLPESAGKVLSTLSATVFCPAYTLRNLWTNFTTANI